MLLRLARIAAQLDALDTLTADAREELSIATTEMVQRARAASRKAAETSRDARTDRHQVKPGGRKRRSPR